MSEIRVGILGALGRMGRIHAQGVIKDKGMILSAVSDKKEEMSKDYGSYIGHKDLGIKIDSAFSLLSEKSDVVIDFSHPRATMPFLEEAAKHGTAVVLGTTGFSASQESKIEKISQRIAIVKSGNFSTGMNLLVGLVKKAAATLGADYDIEIVEQHHRQKIDAPSGSALMLAQAACEARGLKYPQALNHHREGQTGKRPEDEIGVHALRGGGVVGAHDVYFMGKTERIQLAHLAQSREAFSSGVLVALRWVVKQKPGLYSMGDVLGMNAEP